MIGFGAASERWATAVQDGSLERARVTPEAWIMRPYRDGDSAWVGWIIVVFRHLLFANFSLNSLPNGNDLPSAASRYQSWS